MVSTEILYVFTFLAVTTLCQDTLDGTEGQEVAHHSRSHHDHRDHVGPRRISSLARQFRKKIELPKPTTTGAPTVAPKHHNHRHGKHKKVPDGASSPGIPQTPIQPAANSVQSVGRKSEAEPTGSYQLKKYELRGEGKQNLRFRLSARALPSKDRSSKSDPYVVIYYAEGKNQPEIVMGRTRPIINDENPTWDEVFSFPYDPATNQRWHFTVFDRDTHGRDDLIGSAWVKAKYYVDHGQFLKLELESDSPVRPRDSVPTPLLIISKE